MDTETVGSLVDESPRDDGNVDGSGNYMIGGYNIGRGFASSTEASAATGVAATLVAVLGKENA